MPRPIPDLCNNAHEDVEMVFRTYGKFIREDYQKPKARVML